MTQLQILINVCLRQVRHNITCCNGYVLRNRLWYVFFFRIKVFNTMRLLSAIVLSVLVLESCQQQELDQHQPQQIHLSYGGKYYWCHIVLSRSYSRFYLWFTSPETVRDIVVTWSTKQQADSIVKYTTNNPANPSHHYVKHGSSQLFVDGGSLRNSQYIHRVLLDDLKPNRRYGKYRHQFLGKFGEATEW